jgi:hypothetical protein
MGKKKIPNELNGKAQIVRLTNPLADNLPPSSRERKAGRRAASLDESMQSIRDREERENALAGMIPKAEFVQEIKKLRK